MVQETLPYSACARDLMLRHPFNETIPETQLEWCRARTNCWARNKTQYFVHTWNPQCPLQTRSSCLATSWHQNHHGCLLKHVSPRLHRGLKIGAHRWVEKRRSWRSGSLVNADNESQISYNTQGKENGTEDAGDQHSFFLWTRQINSFLFSQYTSLMVNNSTNMPISTRHSMDIKVLCCVGLVSLRLSPKFSLQIIGL